MNTKKERCICEEDNKLTQALCPIHGTPSYRSNPQETEGWEKEFDYLFIEDLRNALPITFLGVKNFIHSELAKSYTKGKEDGMAEEAIGCVSHCDKAVKEAVEKIRGEIKSIRKTPLGIDQNNTELYEAGRGDLEFNSCVDYILSLPSLTNEKE